MPRLWDGDTRAVDTDKKTQETTVTGGGSNSTVLSVSLIRTIVARVVWVACLVLALVLACAAFSFALEANEKNDLVTLVRDLADAFDLGFFDLDNPVKGFDDPNGEVKTALFNYG